MGLLLAGRAGRSVPPKGAVLVPVLSIEHARTIWADKPGVTWPVFGKLIGLVG